MAESEINRKVAEQDIPKILAAIHSGVQSKKKWTLVVEGSDNGGIIDIQLTKKESFK